MKSWLASLLFLPLAAAAVDIPVKLVGGEPSDDPLAAAWLSQAPVVVTLYPQISVPPAMNKAGKSRVKVRAQRGATTLALHLEWTAPRPTTERGVGKFVDAAAMQWPLSPGDELPYVGMGHRGAPVAVCFWRADGTVELLSAEGFGTLTAQPGTAARARGAWNDGRWRVVLSCPAMPSSPEALPVGFAVWNGEGGERDGLKRLSAWQRLRFGGADEHAGLRNMNHSGNAARGKRLMQTEGCAGCHNYPGNPAKPTIGPDLSYAGGMHSAGYLADSLGDPSKIVVPGKGYFVEEDGRRTSIMPPFAGSEAERDDILAFLRSLR